MRLLVVGGGVAGPAVALAATRLGLDATVLERRPVADPDEGSWITVAPNGLDALDVLGVLDEPARSGPAAGSTAMYGATGRHLGDVTLGRPARRRRRRAHDEAVGARRRCSRRPPARRGADVRLGAEVVSVPGRRRVRAVLGDGGDRRRATCSSRADGVRSLVRRSSTRTRRQARYVGLTNFGGITRGTALADDLDARRPGTSSSAAVVLRGAPAAERRRRLVRQRARARRSAATERAATTQAQWLARLVDLVADDAGPASDLVAAGRLELAGRQHLRPAARPHLVARTASCSSGMPRTPRRRAPARVRRWPSRTPWCWPGPWRSARRPTGLAAYEQARRTGSRRSSRPAHAAAARRSPAAWDGCRSRRC